MTKKKKKTTADSPIRVKIRWKTKDGSEHSVVLNEAGNPGHVNTIALFEALDASKIVEKVSLRTLSKGERAGVLAVLRVS